jgi:hypothetical protein
MCASWLIARRAAPTRAGHWRARLNAEAASLEARLAKDDISFSPYEHTDSRSEPRNVSAGEGESESTCAPILGTTETYRFLIDRSNECL